MPIFRRTLNELRRYHRLLMGTGWWAATVVVVLALLAEAAVLVRGYMAEQRERFAVAHRLVKGRFAANEQAFLSGVVRAELSLADERPVRHALVTRFRENGNALYWKPFPDRKLEFLMAAAPSASLDDVTIERYLQLATQIGRATVAASTVLERQPTQLFFSPDLQIFAIMPASVIVNRARLADAAGRIAFEKELTNGIEQLADTVPPHSRDGRPSAYWSSRLHLLPHGQRVLRLAAPVVQDGHTIAILATEIDPEDLVWPLADGGVEGAFGIVDSAGTIVATAVRAGTDIVPQARPVRFLDANRADPDSSSQRQLDGRIVISQPLGDTGYTLVYTYTWRDVLVAIRARTLTVACLLATLLAIVWLLLHLLNRRVFIPMYSRSEQVVESEHLSRTLIETVPVGIGLVSIGTGELLHGGSSLAALGEQINGGTVRLLAELTARYARRLDVYRDAAPELVFVEDVPMPTRDGGEIALQARFAVARFRGEAVLIAAFVDMSASQRLAQQLRDAKHAADQANAAKSSFLAVMSHEIRTPLNAILGNLELFAHSPLNPLQRDRLRTIRASSHGLLAIVQDVLDFSKIEAGEMQLEMLRFNVVDVMTRAVAIFAPIAQAKGVALYATFGTSIDQEMHGDPGRLAQVVHNLLSNAIKFTSAGKVVLRVRFETAPAGGELVVTVEDTGIGIEAAQCAQLFRAFSQADSSISRRFGGTGLGLALCQRLTSGMGGTISVESEVGKGSRFIVRLPLGGADLQAGRLTVDERRFAGHRLTFVAADDEWHAYAVPLMQAWGATVEAVHRPDDIGEVSGRLLVICGDRHSWSAESENRLVEEWQAVVNCGADGPLQPIRVGRMLTVSCYSPAGLRNALEHVLNARPLTAIAAQDVADADETAAPLGLRVLVTEDNEVNQRLVEEQLSLLGCTVQIATDGVDALQRLSDEAFDVVLTDLNMPRMDGYVLAQIMRERWPQTPVVAMTADASIDERRRCTALGVRAVASKPLSLAGLVHVLTEVTNGVGNEAGYGAGGSLLGKSAMPPSLIDAFHRSSTTSLNVLKAAKARGDTRATLAELHSLKGALGIFQQRELGQQCASLEERIKAGGLAQAGHEWQAFVVALAALLAE
ncbi:response regulator [Burkholderia multivorans]|uniref:hybrid sensor histidine kinase/response regulator n=1 Tax=Burkholderia multivorans TaxID=87883 RepID=UPI001C95CE9C|nr:hybrid sensor histidine kinase/response regulator [Burkholderia multivorans]MBY4672341.1 response regulator [Burkholderia multivorans]